jgi:hypothetical protein
VQSVFELAAGLSQLTLIFTKVSFVSGEFPVVIANLLSISGDFLFAGTVTNISAKLGAIVPQLFMVGS